MIELLIENKKVVIDQGELIGFSVDGHEFIHQKGNPGWGNSDTEMFPIIGPTANANYKVKTKNGEAIQDQHGLLREMKYELVERTNTTLLVEKKYSADTIVINSKFPKRSPVKELYWPFSFTFQKQFKLTEEGLHISFIIKGDEGMPFMLGYHPAFQIHSTAASIKSENKNISIPEVLAVGSRALLVEDCEELVLDDTRKLQIKTDGFGNFMLWTEVPNMLCIEPITFYPYTVEQNNLHKGFMVLSKESQIFNMYMCVG